MIFGWRASGRKVAATAANSDAVQLDADCKVYVIGDIHGRVDLLDSVIDAIERDVSSDPVANLLTVTLGDYVDRGPDSRGVIERLAQNPFPTSYVALQGNHEEMLQKFMVDSTIGDYWRGLGGLETLHSYGIPVATLMLGAGWPEASDALCDAVPPEHLRFLASLRPSVALGPYFLCHAGVRPGIALDRQQLEDLLWIREEFLTSKMNFGKIVIHGHTPVEEPEILPNRINIDTGAFATGRLTCLVLQGTSRRFLAH